MKSRRCVQDKLDYCVIDIGVEQQQRVSHLFAGQHFITKRNNISLCHEIASFKYLTALLFKKIYNLYVLTEPEISYNTQ